MSPQQVERLLGGAPGHYGRNWGPTSGTLECCPAEGRYEVWTNDDTMLEITFDEDSRVVQKHKRAHFHRYGLIGYWLWRYLGCKFPD